MEPTKNFSPNSIVSRPGLKPVRDEGAKASACVASVQLFQRAEQILLRAFESLGTEDVSSSVFLKPQFLTIIVLYGFDNSAGLVNGRLTIPEVTENLRKKISDIKRPGLNLKDALNELVELSIVVKKAGHYRLNPTLIENAEESVKIIQQVIFHVKQSDCGREPIGSSVNLNKNSTDDGNLAQAGAPESDACEFRSESFSPPLPASSLRDLEKQGSDQLESAGSDSSSRLSPEGDRDVNPMSELSSQLLPSLSSPMGDSPNWKSDPEDVLDERIPDPEEATERPNSLDSRNGEPSIVTPRVIFKRFDIGLEELVKAIDALRSDLPKIVDDLEKADPIVGREGLIFILEQRTKKIPDSAVAIIQNTAALSRQFVELKPQLIQAFFDKINSVRDPKERALIPPRMLAVINENSFQNKMHKLVYLVQNSVVNNARESAEKLMRVGKAMVKFERGLDNLRLLDLSNETSIREKFEGLDNIKSLLTSSSHSQEPSLFDKLPELKRMLVTDLRLEQSCLLEVRELVLSQNNPIDPRQDMPLNPNSVFLRNRVDLLMDLQLGVKESGDELVRVIEATCTTKALSSGYNRGKQLGSIESELSLSLESHLLGNLGADLYDGLVNFDKEILILGNVLDELAPQIPGRIVEILRKISLNPLSDALGKQDVKEVMTPILKEIHSLSNKSRRELLTEVERYQEEAVTACEKLIRGLLPNSPELWDVEEFKRTFNGQPHSAESLSEKEESL